MHYKKVLSLLLAASILANASLTIVAEETDIDDNSIQASFSDEGSEARDSTEMIKAASAETVSVEETAMDPGTAAPDIAPIAEDDAITVSAEEVPMSEKIADDPIITSTEALNESENTATDGEAVEVTANASITSTETEDVSKELTEGETLSEDGHKDIVVTGDLDDNTLPENSEQAVMNAASESEDTNTVQSLGNVSENKTNTHYISIDETLAFDEKTYQVVMAGIPEGYKDDFIDFIRTFSEEDAVKLEYVNDNLIDAEKTYRLDDQMCWAASTANMLWNSGWGRIAINPMTNEPFASEDEIFIYFSSRMTNSAGNPWYGISWFFDALYYPQHMNAQAAKLKKAEIPAKETMPFLAKSDGLLSDLVADQILDLLSPVGNLSVISSLQDLVYDSADSISINLCINLFRKGEQFIGSHALTAFGLIIDALEETVETMYKAVIVADSNGYSAIRVDSDQAQLDELMEQKASNKNAYQLYQIRPYEHLDGNQYWELVNYRDDHVALLKEIVTFRNYSEELKEEITEVQGSKDVGKNIDYALTELSGDKTIYEPGEEIRFHVAVNNWSHYSAGTKDVVALPVYMRLFDGNKLVWENEYSIWTVKSYGTTSDDINLSEIVKDLTAGTYTFEFTLNPYSDDAKLKEAYYLNNTRSITFVVKGTEEESETSEDKESDNPQEKEVEESQEKESGTSPEKTPEISTEEFTDPAPEKTTETCEEEDENRSDTADETERMEQISDLHNQRSYDDSSYDHIWHALEVENDGVWDLSKDEKDYFTVKVFYPKNEFHDLYKLLPDEITEKKDLVSDQKQKTGKIRVEEKNYRITEEENGFFMIEIYKEYLKTLREGKHTFGISLFSMTEELTFEVDIQTQNHSGKYR